MRKIFFLLVFGFFLSPLFASKGSLRVVGPWEIKNLEPSVSGYVFQRMQVAENLVGVDKQGELTPELSSGWTVDRTGLVWEFKIRKGILFHDGETLTPASVAKALNCSLEKSGFLAKAPVSGITSTEDTVKISLNSHFSILPATLAHYSMIILSPDSYQNCETVRLSGTGPYKVAKLKLPKSAEFESFENYRKTKARIAKTSYLAVGRGETRALMAESGDADIVYTIDPASLLRLKSQGKVNIFERPIPRTVVIKLNAAHPFLSDPLARRAISLAIDRRGISEGIMRSEGMEANQLFPAILKNWHLADLKVSPGSPQKSAELLERLGWKKNADGFFEKNGKLLQLELITYASRPILPVIATAIQNQLNETGIKTEVSIVNSGSIPLKHKDGTLQMALMARLYSSIPDPLGVVLQDYDKDGGDWGAMNWSNEQVVSDLEKLVKTGDESKKAPLIRKIAETLHRELPTVPVVYYRHSAAVNKKLRGFHLDPLERNYYLSDLEFE